MGSDQQDKIDKSNMDKAEGCEELTGIDYFMHAPLDLVRHPDYSRKAMLVISAVSQMTSAQLEALNIEENF